MYHPLQSIEMDETVKAEIFIIPWWWWPKPLLSKKVDDSYWKFISVWVDPRQFLRFFFCLKLCSYSWQKLRLITVVKPTYLTALKRFLLHAIFFIILWIIWYLNMRYSNYNIHSMFLNILKKFRPLYKVPLNVSMQQEYL